MWFKQRESLVLIVKYWSTNITFSTQLSDHVHLLISLVCESFQPAGRALDSFQALAAESGHPVQFLKHEYNIFKIKTAYLWPFVAWNDTEIRRRLDNTLGFLRSR